MTVRARPRRRSDDPFLWSQRWPMAGADGAGAVESVGSVGAAVSGRDLPGFGTDDTAGSPLGSGNLGLNVGDDPEQVQRRRQALAAAVGAERVVMPVQVHGDTVVVVDEALLEQSEPPEADALVTSLPGVLLGVTVADCVPVMLLDPVAGLVGVVHAGRAGMVARITSKTVSVMEQLGARNLQAVVGPSICARCYEVPEDLRAVVAVSAPLSASVTRTGSPSIDVAAGVLAELHGRAEVQLLPGCTAETPELFSHRASDGAAGRFAGFVWIGSAGEKL